MENPEDIKPVLQRERIGPLTIISILEYRKHNIIIFQAFAINTVSVSVAYFVETKCFLSRKYSLPSFVLYHSLSYHKTELESPLPKHFLILVLVQVFLYHLLEYSA